MCPNLGRGERSIMADLKENLMTGLFGEVPAKPQTDILDEPDIEIDLDQLLDFHSGIVPGKEHPWSGLSDGKAKELRESIAVHGLLQPIIVREDEKNGFYEILAGHNRRDALRENGIKKLSVKRGEIKIVSKDTYDSGDIMLDSNIQRDEVPVMDRAWACRIKLEIVQHRMRVSQLGTHKRSDQIAAEELEMSRNNVQRYARLTYLTQPLQELANTTQLPINVGVEASYLSAEQQNEIFSVWKDVRKLPNIQQMKQIREEATKEFIDADTLKAMLVPEKSSEPIKSAFKSTQKRFQKEAKEKSALIDTQVLEELLAKTVQEYLDTL